MSNQTPPRLDDPNFAKLTEHIQTLLAEVETLPYPKVQEDIYELLNCLDLLHREALLRLLQLIEANAPTLKQAMADDFAIQTVMMLYNFVPDEAVLVPGEQSGTFIPLNEVSIAPTVKMPVWIPVDNLTDLPSDSLHGQVIEGERVLFCRVDEQIIALQNACLESVLPLDRGTLAGTILTCPWHGCQYDVRTGEIQNGSGLRLPTFPVKVEGTRCWVGFNIPDHMRDG